MKEDIRAVELVAELRQIKTAVDYSVTVTINIPESCKEQVKSLLDWQGKMIRIVAVLEEVN